MCIWMNFIGLGTSPLPTTLVQISSNFFTSPPIFAINSSVLSAAASVFSCLRYLFISRLHTQSIFCAYVHYYIARVVLTTAFFQDPKILEFLPLWVSCLRWTVHALDSPHLAAAASQDFSRPSSSQHGRLNETPPWDLGPTLYHDGDSPLH